MFPGSIGVGEMVVIGVVAVLLFGSRLPEVARSLGQSYQQFRKGLSEIQSSINAEIDVNKMVNEPPEYNDYVDDYEEPTSPKFIAPPEEDSQTDSVSDSQAS